MSATRWIIGLAAIAAGVSLYLFSGDSEDKQIAEQLAREQNRLDADTAPEPNSSEFQPESFQLSRSLTAERNAMRNTWFVSAGEGSFIELPFAPPVNGTLPPKDDSTSGATESAANPESNHYEDNNPGYLGADACAECHRERHDGFVETAHHLTSGQVKPGKIRGHFVGFQNKLQSRDPSLSFTMREDGDKLVQQVTYDDWQLEFPMDVFTGSAKTGQTMLYWHGDALYQNHISYLAKLDQWIPSPGYSDTTVNYARRIRTACLECHITYIDQKRAPNFYHRDSAIFGISCERCHGPGRDHVEFHREHPDEKEGKEIIHPSSLTRQQQLDICAQCHSGTFSLVGDAFSYRPGEDLDAHHKLLRPDASGVGGIHTSNQLTRLKMSKCFEQSEMTCTSCHNPHENQRGKTAAFTKSCLSCHSPDHCGLAETLGDRISDNCVSCHMPIAENEGIQKVAEGAFSVEMIDHYIRVDPAASEAYLSKP